MSNLGALFGNSDVTREPHDGDKLLSLYQNRAELKKEFAGLREEKFRLQEQIREQQGATARLQQILDHLENLLADPQRAANVLVFYQLRGLAARCSRKLARFAAQLTQQREQKQHSAVLASWHEDRTRETWGVEKRILDQKHRIQEQQSQLRIEQSRISDMSIFLRVFKRRSTSAALRKLQEAIEISMSEEAALTQALSEIKIRKPPENGGLDIPIKRSINLLILSFAQKLYLDFADNDIAVLAKEAGEKSVGANNYGDSGACDRLLQSIRKRVELIENTADFAGALQERSKYLGNIALFHQELDTVPVSGSVATLFDIGANGQVAESNVNLVGDNYWNIAESFVR